MTWEEKIKAFEAEHHHHWADIIRAAKVYLDARHVARSHPLAFSSMVHPESDKYPEYKAVNVAYQQAYSNLWMETDIEYDEDGFRNLVWEWRYWKVMARKCCWYQRFGTTDKASETMSLLGEAEEKFFNACGLGEYYKPPCHYIEEAFPNLKKS